MADGGELVEQVVFTAEQAAEVLGLARQSVVDLVRRRRDNGRPVSWGRGEPGNPLPCVLVLASWVVDQAADRNGIRQHVDPLRVHLPVLPGMSSVPSGDWQVRLVESEQTAELYRREATEERMARLEAAVAAARSEAETTRAAAALERTRLEAEVARLSSAIRELVPAPTVTTEIA